MNNICKNIELILKEKNMSWFQLSKLTGISQSTFSDFKKGRQNDILFSTAIKIADALEVSLDELADRK